MAERNSGKLFEDNFKASAKEQNIFIHRIKDLAFSQRSFNEVLTVRTKNPCDFFLFGNLKDGRGNLIGLELKSTKFNSISIQREKNDPEAMIKYHQIYSLTQMSQSEGVWGGFLFNFRSEKTGEEETYFMDIVDFNEFLQNNSKKSINTGDIILYNGLKIEQEIKRVNYRYNVQKMIQDISARKLG